MYAVVDIETTGGSPAVDRIAEIAIILFDGNKVVEEYSTLVNPCRPIDPWVSKLTGITQEMVKNAPLFEDIHQEVLRLTKGNIFTAHNVKFDFGMVRKEFKRIGIDFNAQQLDTVSLSRKVLPGFQSYSLGKLCENIGIAIEARHRALGDAAATVKLLELLLTTDAESKFLNIELRDGLDISKLPPQISHTEIEILPDEAGIFYFKNSNGEVLFFEGAKSIRKKVIQEFSKVGESAPKTAILHQVHSIDYELTGNELIAKLMVLAKEQERDTISGKPVREQQPAFGIFITEDTAGVKQLKVLPLAVGSGESALRFATKNAAMRVMQKITGDNNIYGHYAMLKRLEEKQESTDKLKKLLNEKIENAVKRYLFRATNFFIIGEGIHPDENSVVWVENNEYKGIGTFYKENMETTINNLKEIVKPAKHSTEAQKIIRQYLKKNKTQGIMVY